MAKPKNAALTAASKAKEDEFYTQISDIEKELRHYKKHFKDKIVFLNCDDPENSNANGEAAGAQRRSSYHSPEHQSA